MTEYTNVESQYRQPVPRAPPRSTSRTFATSISAGLILKLTKKKTPTKNPCGLSRSHQLRSSSGYGELHPHDLKQFGMQVQPLPHGRGAARVSKRFLNTSVENAVRMQAYLIRNRSSVAPDPSKIITRRQCESARRSSVVRYRRSGTAGRCRSSNIA